MANTTSEKIRLGIFVIVGTIFLVVAAYLIGNNQSMFNKTFTISTVFKNVNGLQLGNNVRFSGINVGAVKAIEMENDTTIRVSLSIEQKMQRHIKKDAIATIGSDGLVGNMIVNIIPGKGMPEPLQEGDQITSYSRIGTADMLSTLNVTNENAALLTADLLKITNAINNGNGTLGMLITDTLVAANLKQTVNHLKFTSLEASKAMNQLNTIMTSINLDESIAGLILNDTIEAKKIKNIITNLNTSSDSIKVVLANLNETLTNVKDGEGAINYLSNDAEFVNNLEQIIKNINEGTEKFNQNMEALKHNFLTRGYFRKLERLQKKETKKKP
jgi:phospholipid/cholesterol/gamma-HCH transport system substrate-binding protein